MTPSNKDITEHDREPELVRTREEARRSHTLLAAVAEGAPDAIFVKTAEGQYILVNSAAARAAGVPASVMTGSHDYDFFPPEIVKALREHDRAVMASGQAGTYEEKIEVGGRLRTFLSTKAPYRDEDGRILGVIGISRDITERKQQEDRLHFLMEASEYLYGPLEGRKTLQRLAHLAVPYVADWAVIHLVRPDGTLEQTAVAHLDPQKRQLAQDLARSYPPDPAKQNPLFEVIRTGKSMMWAEIPEELLAVVAEDEQHLGVLRGLGLRSALIVPLVRPGRTLGSISFVTSESGRLYSEDDLALAEELARRAALAIENERLFLEVKEIARAFQRSLLPPKLPDLEGLRLGAVYRPAGTSVGGDFYDIFDIGDPGWVVTMGDVCGKGAESAAVTAAVRYTLRAVAIQQKHPGRILAATNEALFGQIDEFRFFTMVCAVIEPPSPGDPRRRITLSVGGHPLPLVLRSDGTVETAGNEGTLLGVFTDPSLSDSGVELGPGDSLLLYTDGALCERPGGVSPEVALAGALAECAGLAAQEIAAKLELYMAAAEECVPTDDTAFLVLQVI